MKECDDILTESFDFITIAKSQNALKILNMICFKDHHLVLLPEVLKAIKKEEIKSKKGQLALTRSNSDFENLGLSKSSKTVVLNMKEAQNKKTLTFDEAKGLLFSKTKHVGEQFGDSPSNPMESHIDEVFKYYLNLSEGKQDNPI